LRQALGNNNVRVYFSGYVTGENTYTILPNDPRGNNYDSDLYQTDENRNRSSDIDSLLAFLPPSMKNSQNDAGERVKLVFNELANPSYL
jgi:hypothetical protein